ncbi:type 11 methyltransferase, partial [Candidatus Magnetobacterium bavaricum]
MNYPANHEYICRVCDNTEAYTLIDGIKDWEYGYPGDYSYRQCTGCDCIQIHPFPSLDELVAAYKIDYHGFTEPTHKGIVYKLLYNLYEKSTMSDLRKIISSSSKILDVGCGIGLFLSRLKSMGVKDIEGIDFSEFAVKHVRFIKAQMERYNKKNVALG